MGRRWYPDTELVMMNVGQTWPNMTLMPLVAWHGMALRWLAAHHLPSAPGTCVHWDARQTRRFHRKSQVVPCVRALVQVTSLALSPGRSKPSWISTRTVH